MYPFFSFQSRVFADPFYCRAAIYASVTQTMKVPYLQLQADGLLTGKFTLQAQTPTVAAGQTSKASRMIYPATGGLKLADAKASFTDKMETFTDKVEFDGSNPVTPDLPSDWKGVSITIPAGVPITLTVSVGLVAEVSATRDNQFKASVGAFARAESSIGLFVFSKVTSPCTDTSWLPTSSYGNICKDVLSKAGVTETQIKDHTSAFLIKQIKTGPTVTTSFTAPTHMLWPPF